MATFYVDTQERDDCYDAFIQSDNPSSYGKYCLYYTLSSTLPPNETCKRLIRVVPPLERLFWRGDILVIRYKGELGMEHKYADVADGLLATVEAVLKKVYDIKGLERTVEQDKKFELEMENSSKFKLRANKDTQS